MNFKQVFATLILVYIHSIQEIVFKRGGTNTALHRDGNSILHRVTPKYHSSVEEGVLGLN